MANLTEQLSEVLPRGKYSVLNLQCVPKESKSIVHHHKNDPVQSCKVVHLIVLFSDDRPVLALEVFVYLDIPKNQNQVLRTIYISKADTSGLVGGLKLNVGRVIQILLRWILLYPIGKYYQDLETPVSINHEANVTEKHKPFVSETDRALHILIERARGNSVYGMPEVIPRDRFSPSINLLMDSPRNLTRLVLFTRSEPQYLFPNSSKNRNKHILSDSGLLKWWLKNVEETVKGGIFHHLLQKKVNILNADKYEVIRYFPSRDSDWQVGDVYSNEVNTNDSAVYHIPLLPDDPKGRFLEHLVLENRIKRVKMKQFWTELSIRQEFRLGITVGLIGVEGVSKRGNDDDYRGLLILKKSQFNRIKELIIGVDYSDAVDYKHVIEELKQKAIEMGEFEGRATSTTNDTTAANVQTTNARITNANTLPVHSLSARKAHNLNTLVRKKKS
ncbi:hypothetical protein FOA43_000827 [Brettanomyces nanus]|uniref:histone acetyltransferase n=1 Tax=Eeniella nana TaxID=13502 RepID=A0A875RX08_EENNA|nr:uncharacterized protein FOA43_000827 [Brettanomyces nanus]QPG73516.1 hypothetical protein FOA43_000827 [Brettanomyces nanus]